MNLFGFKSKPDCLYQLLAWVEDAIEYIKYKVKINKHNEPADIKDKVENQK